MAGSSSSSIVVLSEEKMLKENVAEVSDPLLKEEECVKEHHINEENIPYLTGKPRFDIVLTPTSIGYAAQLCIPKRIVKLLPRASTPVVIKYQDKAWNVLYSGHTTKPRLASGEWRSFVKENELQVGDACVFELMKCSMEMIEFKVMILRCDLPPELAAYLNAKGESEDNPVEID